MIRRLALLLAAVAAAVQHLWAPTPQQPVLAVLGLGDSVPQGAACGCVSFVQRVGDRLGAVQHQAVAVTNVARGGLTSAGLLAQSRTDHLGAGRRQVTLITIGANDFDSSRLSQPGFRASDGLRLYQPALAALRQNLTLVLEQLMRTPDHGPVLVTGYWNVFLDGAVGQRQGAAYAGDSAALTALVNRVLQQVTTRSGATFVDLYRPFKGDGDRDDTALLAADGDHPSAAGHELIAREVLAHLHGAH